MRARALRNASAFAPERRRRPVARVGLLVSGAPLSSDDGFYDRRERESDGLIYFEQTESSSPNRIFAANVEGWVWFLSPRLEDVSDPWGTGSPVLVVPTYPFQAP